MFKGGKVSKFDLFEIYNYLESEKILLSFEGYFTQHVLHNLIDKLEKKFKEELVTEGQDVNISKKIFSIVIEMSQNIKLHSDERIVYGEEVNCGKGIIVVREQNDYFEVSSGNMISTSRVDDFKNYIDDINNKDSDALKDYYKEVLKKPRVKGNISAGLGLIQMKRKSNNELKYNFRDIEDNNKKFFTLTCEVSK